MLEQATGLPGTSREEFDGTESADFDPTGFSDQVLNKLCLLLYKYKSVKQ